MDPVVVKKGVVVGLGMATEAVWEMAILAGVAARKAAAPAVAATHAHHSLCNLCHESTRRCWNPPSRRHSARCE